MLQHLRIVLSLLFVALTAAPAAAEPVAKWSRWERTFTAPTERDDIALTLSLTSPSGKKHQTDGFFDGGNTYRVRFMPGETGEWSYTSASAPAVDGLHGSKGTFRVEASDSQNPLLQRGPVRVAEEGRYLVHADGTPFFWLGDTTWNGPAKSTAEDWQTYLADRQDKHFNVIQYNAVVPWRAAQTDANGNAAFTGRKNIQINPEYFQRLDKRIDAVNDAGMVAAHILIWSLTDKDPGKYLPEEDVVKIVRYQLARYGAHHMVWILAGDNPYQGERAQRWKRIGRKVFGDNPSPTPVTTHSTGMNFPWADWQNEDWLDVLGYQSGHGDDANKWRWIHSGPAANFWPRTNKPIINMEPCYEDHNAYHSRKPHSALNVRRDVYYSLLSHPSAGVTYGGHGIWSWQTVRGEEPADHGGSGVAKIWYEALELPGSRHMQHVADLFRAVDWPKLRPDDKIVAEQPHGDDPAKRIVAATTSDGKT